MITSQIIHDLERRCPQGLTVPQILETAGQQQVELSEATFRKYVQLGLLPRCRRVGRKGKHRGSAGLYPVHTLRRLFLLRKLMKQGFTLDDIRRSFWLFREDLDEVEVRLGRLIGQLRAELRRQALAPQRRRSLEREIESSEDRARHLTSHLSNLSRELASGLLPPEASETPLAGSLEPLTT